MSDESEWVHNYARDCITNLRERAADAAATQTDAFGSGRAMAYFEVLSHLNNQLESFDLQPESLGMKDIDGLLGSLLAPKAKESRQVQVPLEEVVEVFRLLEEFNQFLHQPMNYADSEKTKSFADRYHQTLSRLYYGVVWGWLPQDVQDEITGE